MTKKGDDKKTTIDDWMIRISFAEAGEPDEGFKLTGEEVLRRTRLALDRMKVERSVKQDTDTTEGKEIAETSSGPSAPAGADEGKVSVMILDDEPIVGKRLSPTLTKHGFHVEVFEDPVKAVARLDEVQFDIVVTDVRMEGLDGIAVLEHIMSQGKNTRVILITGYATIEVAREALVKGAFDFIAKPFKPKELSAVINKAALSLGHGGIM